MEKKHCRCIVIVVNFCVDWFVSC